MASNIDREHYHRLTIGEVFGDLAFLRKPTGDRAEAHYDRLASMVRLHNSTLRLNDAQEIDISETLKTREKIHGRIEAYRKNRVPSELRDTIQIEGNEQTGIYLFVGCKCYGKPIHPPLDAGKYL